MTFAFAGFPLWWVLGISNFVGHIAAVILLIELLRLKRIRVPRSFGLWLLFLAWVAVGVLMLQVDAPYAVSTTSMGSYITWAYRFGWYIAATIFLLYIGNMRDRLSTERIVRSLSMFFLAIVAGGWIAIVAPGLEFPSLLEVILPRQVSQVDFVNFLIHPTVVQDYAASAAEQPRPSAPFAYANFWGLNFACALPFFIMDWLGPAATWRRRMAAVPILLLAAVPAILSWNRGLWLAVLAMVAVVAIRSAVRGHVKALIALVSATLILVGGISLSPLGDVIQSRIDNPTSNSTRSKLATLTTLSALEGSPIVGFGSTRDSASSFYSIAGGDRPSCPNCSPPALGTQGQFWLVLYAQGVLGLVFFLGFLLIWFARGLRTRAPASIAAICVLVAHFVTMTIYDSLGIGTIVLLVGVALLWREFDDTHPSLPTDDGSYTLGGYARLLRQNAVWVAVWAAVGLVVGVSLQLWQGNPVIASASIIISPESASDTPGYTTSLDTMSQLARSNGVRSAMEEAIGEEPGALEVSATPNSRILNLRYTGGDTGSTVAAVTAAADAVLAAQLELKEEERNAVVARLDAQYAALLRSVSIVDDSLQTLAQDDRAADAAVLQQTRARLLAESAAAANESARVGSLTFESGRFVRPATARVTYTPLLVTSVSGMMLGLLLGLVTARLRDMRRTPVGNVRDLSTALEVDVLARVDQIGARFVAAGSGLKADARRHPVTSATRRFGALSVVPGDDTPLSRELAAELDNDLRHDRLSTMGVGTTRVNSVEPPRMVFVVSAAEPFGSLTWRLARWRRNDMGTLGLVVITDSAPPRKSPMRLSRDRNSDAGRK